MRKILHALFLALVLAFGAPSSARDFQQVKVYGVNGEAVLQGWELMRSVLMLHLPSGTVIDWPAQIKARFDPRYLGCYGPWCIEEAEVLPADVNGEPAWDTVYNRDLAHNHTVYINTWLLPTRKMLVLVIAHELTHHVLTINGYSVRQQHDLMARIDEIYIEHLRKRNI